MERASMQDGGKHKMAKEEKGKIEQLSPQCRNTIDIGIPAYGCVLPRNHNGMCYTGYLRTAILLPVSMMKEGKVIYNGRPSDRDWETQP